MTDIKRAQLRAKPPRERKRVNLPLSGFVWSLVGAGVVGGFLNTISIVILALTFAK